MVSFVTAVVIFLYVNYFYLFWLLGTYCKIIVVILKY